MDKQTADGTSYLSSLIAELRTIRSRSDALYFRIQEKRGKSRMIREDPLESLFYEIPLTFSYHKLLLII